MHGMARDSGVGPPRRHCLRTLAGTPGQGLSTGVDFAHVRRLAEQGEAMIADVRPGCRFGCTAGMAVRGHLLRVVSAMAGTFLALNRLIRCGLYVWVRRDIRSAMADLYDSLRGAGQCICMIDRSEKLWPTAGCVAI